MDFFYIMLLAVSVSLDALIAGTAYGLRGIRLGLSSLLVLGLVTAGCTTIAMICAKVLGNFINAQFAMLLGAILLLMLGIWNLLHEYLVKKVTNNKESQCQLALSVGQLLICIMLKPEIADLNQSNDISPGEALLFGLALGIDNMVATFGASLIGALPLYTPLVMGVMQVFLIIAGAFAVNLIDSARVKRHLPFLPGTILIILALLRFKF